MNLNENELSITTRGGILETHLSYSKIANCLNIPVSTMYQYNREGTGPKTLQIGKHLRVSQSDFEYWLTENVK